MRYNRRMKRTSLVVGLMLLAGAAGAMEDDQIVNYDESKVPAYTLEDPLTFVDGRKVSSPDQWPARRAELVKLFAREMYGQIPPNPETVVFELLEEGETFAGRGLRRQYRIWFKADKSGPCIDWLVVLPKGPKGPFPLFIMLNYGGNHELLDDPEVLVPTWLIGGQVKQYYATAMTRGLMRRSDQPSLIPVDQIIAHGYAFMSANYNQVTPDVVREIDGDKLFESMIYTGVFSLWPKRDPKRDDNTTSLGAWAWSLSRGLDLAEKIPEIDTKRNVVCGCSRLGKSALLAASRDERFTVCIPNQTGGGGAPLAKRYYGECVRTEVTLFEHWYCRAYDKYAEDVDTWKRKTPMPFDQHLMLATIAPRPLLIMGFDKGWFDTKGEFLAVKAASPVWEFLGKGGMPAGDWPDDFDTSMIGRDLGYVRRPGLHGIAACDWKWLLDFADRHIFTK